MKRKTVKSTAFCRKRPTLYQKNSASHAVEVVRRKRAFIVLKRVEKVKKTYILQEGKKVALYVKSSASSTFGVVRRKKASIV